MILHQPQNVRTKTSSLPHHVKRKGQQAKRFGFFATLSCLCIQQGGDIGVEPQSETAIFFVQEKVKRLQPSGGASLDFKMGALNLASSKGRILEGDLDTK